MEVKSSKNELLECRRGIVSFDSKSCVRSGLEKDFDSSVRQCFLKAGKVEVLAGPVFDADRKGCPPNQHKSGEAFLLLKKIPNLLSFLRQQVETLSLYFPEFFRLSCGRARLREYFPHPGVSTPGGDGPGRTLLPQRAGL